MLAPRLDRRVGLLDGARSGVRCFLLVVEEGIGEGVMLLHLLTWVNCRTVLELVATFNAPVSIVWSSLLVVARLSIRSVLTALTCVAVTRLCVLESLMLMQECNSPLARLLHMATQRCNTGQVEALWAMHRIKLPAVVTKLPVLVPMVGLCIRPASTVTEPS